MKGAAMSGACAASASTGAHAATRAAVVIHNTTRRQLAATLRIAEASPKVNKTTASHTAHSGRALGKPAGFPCDIHFPIARSTRSRMRRTLSPTASRIESEPMTAAGTNT